MRVPRLSEHYEVQALYFFELGGHDDEKDYRAYRGQQIALELTHGDEEQD